jgi:hypothetical protein
MDKKLTGLMSVFLLSFALFLSLVFLNTTLGKNSRASSTTKPSTDNSFILAFPLELSTTSATPSSLTIFVRDADTKPLQNRNVALSATAGSVQPSTVTTDTDGKATAQFSCNGASPSEVAQINAVVDNSFQLTKTVTIKCD